MLSWIEPGVATGSGRGPERSAGASLDAKPMNSSHFRYMPYCGAPPTIGTIWERWNLDPVLIACLVLCLALVVAARVPGETSAHRRSRIGLFAAGWGVAAAALVSPLCALSVSLFAARVGQHMILTTIAAPLVALGLSAPRGRIAGNALAGAAAFTAMLWLWHAPGPYAATFDSDIVYWAMHLTTFGAALWLWRAVFHAPPRRMAAAIAATLIAGVQMALLGAVIAFTAYPVYAPHLLTTMAWGLSPLQDQQLGGLIMWLPAGAIFAAAIMAPLGLALRARAPHPLRT